MWTQNRGDQKRVKKPFQILSKFQPKEFCMGEGSDLITMNSTSIMSPQSVTYGHISDFLLMDTFPIFFLFSNKLIILQLTQVFFLCKFF